MTQPQYDRPPVYFTSNGIPFIKVEELVRSRAFLDVVCRLTREERAR